MYDIYIYIYMYSSLRKIVRNWGLTPRKGLDLIDLINKTRICGEMQVAIFSHVTRDEPCFDGLPEASINNNPFSKMFSTSSFFIFSLLQKNGQPRFLIFSFHADIKIQYIYRQYIQIMHYLFDLNIQYVLYTYIDIWQSPKRQNTGKSYSDIVSDNVLSYDHTIRI